MKDLDCSSSLSVSIEKGIVIFCVLLSLFLVKDIFRLSTLLLISLSQSTELMMSRSSSEV